MKFTSTAAALRKAFAEARSVISPKPNLLARGGAYVTVAGNGKNPVRVTGSNDQVTVIAAVQDAKAVDKGEALVNPVPIAGFLSTIPADTPLEVETSDTHLTITRNGAQPYSFVLMHADYPATQAVRGTKASVDLSRLPEAVESVKRSVGESGVAQFRSTSEDLMLASTDNFRMTQSSVAGAGFGEYVGVLPVAALDRLARVNPGLVTFDSKAINAVSDEVSLTIRALHDESFPDVSSVLVQKPSNMVTAQRAVLVDALQRLHSVDSEATVALGIDQSSMVLTLAGSSAGHGQEEVEVSGGPATLFTISVNLRFLLDAARSIKGEQIVLGFTAPDSILFLRGKEAEMQVTAAVMPVLEGGM